MRKIADRDGPAPDGASGSPVPDGPAPDCSTVAPDGTDFDLERALWDMDYRREVLDALRQARLRPGAPAAARSAPFSPCLKNLS